MMLFSAYVVLAGGGGGGGGGVEGGGSKNCTLRRSPVTLSAIF